MNEGGILLNIRFSVKKDEGRKKYLFDESELYNFGDRILNAHIINEKRSFLFSVGMNSLFSGEEGHLSFVAKRKLNTIFILLYCLPDGVSTAWLCCTDDGQANQATVRWGNCLC